MRTAARPTRRTCPSSSRTSALTDSAGKAAADPGVIRVIKMGLIKVIKVIKVGLIKVIKVIKMIKIVKDIKMIRMCMMMRRLGLFVGD